MTSTMNTTGDALSEAIGRETNRLVELYDFSDEVTVSLLSESENKIYLVSDPVRSGNYVIRVNSGRLGYHTPPSIASELMWLTALRRDTDILVPEVLTAKDGSIVQTINAPDFDQPRHAAIYSFLPGSEPPEDDLVPGFKRLGEISARMHLHAKDWNPPTNFKRHAWTPDVILDDHLNWGRWQDGAAMNDETIRLLSQLDNVVRNRLAALPTDRDHFGLIHADLRLANILVDGDNTAIIDFDDCGFGWYLFDLAAALSFLEERPDVPGLIESWLEGYRKIAGVPRGAEREIPTLIMLRRLQLISWLGYQQHHLDFAREIGAKYTEDSCWLADDYLAKFA